MFRPNWPSSGVQVAVTKESAAMFSFPCMSMPRTIQLVGYTGYSAVAMHVFDLSVICEVLYYGFHFKVHIYVYSVSVYLMLLTDLLVC
jgi:hypothetical protein